MPRSELIENDRQGFSDAPVLSFQSAAGANGYRELNVRSDTTVPPEFGNLTILETTDPKNSNPGEDETGRDSSGRITHQKTAWGSQSFEYETEGNELPIDYKLKSMTVTDSRGTTTYDRQPDGTYRSVSPDGEVSTYKDIEAIQTSGSQNATVKFVDPDGASVTRHADGSTWNDDSMGRRVREYDARTQLEKQYEYEGSDPMFPSTITTVDAIGNPVTIEKPVKPPQSEGGTTRSG